MSKTEHAAPSAKELREAAQELIAALLQMRHIENMSEDEFPLAARRKLEALLASGPTLEERLMSEWHRSVTSKDTNLVRRNDRFDAAHRAMFDHARKLSEEAGK